MEDKKQRSANFTNYEKTLLAELVMKYKDIVENKRTDATSNVQKAAGWTRLAQEFNSMSSNRNRTPNSLKTCWENIKRNTKKQVSDRKKQIFKTGGGQPQPTNGNSSANVIVEAVLGPALEGLPNIYDSDEPEYGSSNTAQPVITKNDPANWSPGQITCDEQWTNEAIVISVAEDDKENRHQQDYEKGPSTFTTEESEKTHLHTNKELWESWTPKTLKMPLAEPLRSNNEKADEWIRRRRPKTDCSADVLMKEKIELVRILKKNAEEEGNLRILILKEQLKQEQTKTDKLKSAD
ncbi:hypothetical protein PYW08_002060 [Mythimna loreyi]|uniref:Uncharacterized protein n=4 Tax=Mythimna loreyi TaxID=667449 RepID=A0ACC2Q2C7_9NEOP|nr:hypothetical protein PYW08_010877 [Mythimna loreyi]KAJ8719847.1 hypothetical protein PYW08_012022 [Mythimna loreyi]KAJ8728362.1 hypothetical protein PYW08_016747 [Mythimna loreyi]KAJ8730647.1 hypothetical protein PYW08_002060 [Mythimna loreyi]